METVNYYILITSAFFIEIGAIISLLWMAFHEKQLIRWENRIFRKIRRRVRRTRNAAERGAIAVVEKVLPDYEVRHKEFSDMFEIIKDVRVK